MASQDPSGGPSPGAARRARLSWCLFDWANSAFPTVIISFVFAAYFTRAVAESPTLGTAQWGRAIGVAALVVAVLSPIVGAIADKRGRRKPWLAAFTALCVVSSAMLWFTLPSPDYVMWALIFVALGSMGLDFAMVFYNSMLATIAAPGRVGRLSGWGWALGYLGGLLCLVLAMVWLVEADSPWFGLAGSEAENVRGVTLLVALWFALFSLPLFLFTPDQAATGMPLKAAAREGLKSLVHTVRSVRRYGPIARFLIARMIYTDGLNTLFAFAGVYAAGTFAMNVAEVVRFGIALNVTAGLGAALFAWVDDWIGSLRTIFIALIGLLVVGTLVLAVESKTLFWISALALGLFVGPVQAASRSLMVRLAPPEMRTEMFGLYALSGKVTAFVGPFLVGAVTLAFDSQRIGMVTILVFFALGMLLLLPLRKHLD